MNHERDVGHTIKTLSNEMDRYMLSHEGKYGITRMQGWLIGYLHSRCTEQDVFQKDIETDFNIRRSTATGILKLMEKNGLITRTAVKCDARLKKIILTSKSERIYDDIRLGIEKIEQKLTDGISAQELDTFFKITEKMRKNMAVPCKPCTKSNLHPCAPHTEQKGKQL